MKASLCLFVTFTTLSKGILYAQSGVAMSASVSAGTTGSGMVSSGAGELSIPQGTGSRSSLPDDALVTLNIEAVPLQSGYLGFISGFETATQKVFGQDVHMVADRDKHWQLVVRDATTGEAIDGLGWGSTGHPVDYAKTLGSDYTRGETYTDARWNCSRPAIDPRTGKEFEPKVMIYGEARTSLENAKSSMAIYSPYNDSNWVGAAIGKDSFYKGKHIVDDQAMIEWIAKNCQQWAIDEFSKIEKPTLAEYLSKRNEGIAGTDSGIGNTSRIRQATSTTEETSSGILNKDRLLHSLADLLETGEEIVEVREDMREDRRERKERERAERERKAAEEERLRQQQLAEQRKKSQVEQKTADKKSPKSTSTQKSKTSAEKTPQPQTATKQKTSSGVSGSGTSVFSLDFSRLNAIYEKRMAVLQEIYALPDGDVASSEQRKQVNDLLDEYKAELSNLEKNIDKAGIWLTYNGKKVNSVTAIGELNTKKWAQTELMTRLMQRCRNAGKF